MWALALGGIGQGGNTIVLAMLPLNQRLNLSYHLMLIYQIIKQKAHIV